MCRLDGQGGGSGRARRTLEPCHEINEPSCSILRWFALRHLNKHASYGHYAHTHTETLLFSLSHSLSRTRCCPISRFLLIDFLSPVLAKPLDLYRLNFLPLITPSFWRLFALEILPHNIHQTNKIPQSAFGFQILGRNHRGSVTGYSKALGLLASLLHLCS